MARQHAAGQTQVHEERAKECTASRGGGSAAPSGREPPSRRMASESPATRPGISYRCALHSAPCGVGDAHAARTHAPYCARAGMPALAQKVA
jgi:hypothetical protein